MWGSLLLLGAGAAAVAWLAPGGLGVAGHAEVTGGASASAYRWITGAVSAAPTWTDSVLEIATEGTLALLALMLVWQWWTAVRRADARRAAGTVLVGVGAMAAYAVSEALKLVVDEERPCRALAGVDAIAGCPGAGDWSFPSNHATLATAVAVGLTILRPRVAAVALPVAGVAAVLRLVVGVHYPHDVLAGVILGGTAAAAVLVALLPVGVRVASQLAGLRRGSHARLVRHDSGSGSVVDAQARQE